jgi:hypothetical protein
MSSSVVLKRKKRRLSCDAQIAQQPRSSYHDNPVDLRPSVPPQKGTMRIDILKDVGQTEL